MKLSIVLKIFKFFMTISMLMWMTVYAHLGDTDVDVNGCHTNSSTGESHCHDSDSSSDGVGSDTSSSDSSSTSSPTSSLTNNPLYTNGYSKGFAEGKALCQKSPRACGLSLNAPAGSSRSEEEIKAECQIDPASCGIETGNSDGSAETYIAQGIAQCQKDPQCCEIAIDKNTTCSTQACTDICRNKPSDCGINITGTLEEGIQQCQNDPSSCGIIQNADGSLEKGIQQCQNDPSSCGIIVSSSVNDAVREIKAQCQKNPAICGIEVNSSTSPSDDSCTSVIVHGSFSLNDGRLFLPAVDVPTAFDGTVTTFEIEMEIIPGREPLSFTIINVVPVEK
jgi:hypothetical protein